MNTFIFLLVLGAPTVTAVIHSLRYFYTSSSNVPNFPQFVSVGYVDDVQITHYDSNTRRAVPTQDWMAQNTDTQYWERNTGIFMNDQQEFKVNIEIARQRFNQTEGLHIVQRMYGCEWDDETGEVKGYHQYGYDGEDFLSLDLETETWIAPVQQAVITKHNWDRDRADLSYLKHYHTKECPDWLKKYVNYGRSSLLRTELPSIKLLQKTPSSPVTCHATGFYPRHALMFWRRDGEELHDGVDHGEMLPHPDGTFQMSVDLDISLIRPEDWRRYHCVFQLSGVKEDLTLTLDKREIGSNWKDPAAGVVPAVIGAVVVVVVVVVLSALVGLVLWRKRSAGFQAANIFEKPPPVQQTEKETTQIKPCEDDKMLSISSSSSGVSVSHFGSYKPLIKNDKMLSISSSSYRDSVSSVGSDTPLIKGTN